MNDLFYLCKPDDPKKEIQVPPFGPCPIPGAIKTTPLDIKNLQIWGKVITSFKRSGCRPEITYIVIMIRD